MTTETLQPTAAQLAIHGSAAAYHKAAADHCRRMARLAPQNLRIIEDAARPVADEPLDFLQDYGREMAVEISSKAAGFAIQALRHEEAERKALITEARDLGALAIESATLPGKPNDNGFSCWDFLEVEDPEGVKRAARQAYSKGREALGVGR